MKLLLNLIGVLAVALAVLGVFLPLLPTTPFLLLASACFLRSSPRLHRWLHDTPILGRHLADFEAGRGVTLRVKAAALALLWTSLALSAWAAPLPWVAWLLVALGVGVSAYLLFRLPTRR